MFPQEGSPREWRQPGVEPTRVHFQAFLGPHSLLPTAVRGTALAVTPTLRKGWTPTPVSSPPPQPLSGAEGLGAALAAAMVGTSVFTIRAWQEQVRPSGKNAENKQRREPAGPVRHGHK